MPVDAKELIQWQEKMSNSAHQRQMADLKAAGLNPVLSAKLGGASTPSGTIDHPETLDTSIAAGSAYGSSGGGGYSAASGGIPNDGSIFGNLISSLNPNGTTRIGKLSLPNWIIQGAYQTLFGDGGSVTPADVANLIGDRTGSTVSGTQLASALEDHYGLDDEGWESRSPLVNGKPWLTVDQVANNIASKIKAASARRQARGRELDRKVAEMFS